MDYIEIKRFKLTLFIGIYEWEKQHLQTLYIDLKLWSIDLTRDNQPTLDYFEVCKQLHHRFHHKRIGLIETLAEDMASFLKQNFPIGQITLTITKQVVLPGEPEAVCLTINR